MQVLCVVSNDDGADVTCPACGQGYAVYYSRQFPSECESALAEVRTTLLEHHAADPTVSAHPADRFNVPAWSGPPHMSAAALLSGAPLRRTNADDTSEPLI